MNNKRKWSLGLMVLALIIVSLACGSSSDGDQLVRTLAEPGNGGQQQNNASTKPAVAPTPIPTQEIEGLIKEGTHLVGTNIEPGIYVGLAGEGLLGSCYWARLSNLTGSGDILANDNATGLYYLEVLPTDKALETACDLLPLDKVPPRGEFLTVLPPGTYLIGRDIEAGLYQGIAGDDILESCYWARLSNVSGSNNILANDNATGQYYIEVLPTDFALQVSCSVEKIE
ncbi:MAG: hypothetical protein OEZ02_05565 [Anaerolineae bacterium]|nr:hypothetical protein [Anaerolineae bacterium]